MVSPSSRQAEMLKKSTSSLRDLTRLTAIPKEQTGIPSLVKRNSGSLVMLPASMTRLKLTTSLSSFCVPAQVTIQEHSRFSSARTLVHSEQCRRSAFGNGHLQFLVFDGGDHIPVLIVAEHLRADPLELFEGLGRGVPVGVIHTALDDGDLGRKAAEEERGR